MKPPRVKKRESYMDIRGVRVNNLKNVSLRIPRNTLTVITGLSGSGKSSLAYDTIYAEGQRRYVESLSSYARQFLGRIRKPAVDFIYGIPPAIAIEQKVTVRNAHSTVGTSTEIYEYLKLLYARIGVTYSPVSGEPVRKDSVTDVVNAMLQCERGSMVLVMYPVAIQADLSALTGRLRQDGVSRVLWNGEVVRVDDLSGRAETSAENPVCYAVLDRVQISDDADETARYADSVQLAFESGGGRCALRLPDGAVREYSNRFERDGMTFEEPSTYLFSFNNSYGACPKCEGFGTIIGIDERLVVPDKSLSIYGNAVACWRGETMSVWKDRLLHVAERFGFPVHKPYEELSEKNLADLWHGNRYFPGIDGFFAYVDEHRYKIQYRVMKARFSGRTVCPLCGGSRIRPDAAYVKVGGKSIQELVEMPAAELLAWFEQLSLTDFQLEVARRLLLEIKSRLSFLCDVGLGYLTLSRRSATLSGGESQRINLAKSLGSSLVGSLYILDEPSVGLHPRDTEMLVKVLKALRDVGNTVLVVEHDRDIISAADYLVDVGPGAGTHGGEIVFAGPVSELDRAERSVTADYLSGRKSLPVPSFRRPWHSRLKIVGAAENNLKHIDVEFPLHTLCVVTGVSGSGKSTLVRNILYPALARYFEQYDNEVGEFRRLEGDLKEISAVECIDQHPIGKSSRSNPVTYCKAYDEIRKLFAEQPAAQYNNLKPMHFTFNSEGGRCEMCQGEGTITVEMQFMADVKLECEACHGRRFKDEVLEVTYRGKNIYDVLEMSVDEAVAFFGEHPSTLEKRIIARLTPLQQVGLGYIKLGQSSSTLSGGENHRVKLASFLVKTDSIRPTLFIFDEPTTGLHLHDIRVLVQAFNALIEQGHSVIVIEHNVEVMKSADWIIDMGPEAGEAGGRICCAGTPEQVAADPESRTAGYLRQALQR